MEQDKFKGNRMQLSIGNFTPLRRYMSVSYCKGYHVAYDFNWRIFLHPVKSDKALVIDQREETILSNIGIVLDNLGNHTGAIRYFDKARAIDPKYALALTDKGIVLDRLGNLTGAIELYDKALAIQPNNTYALNNKGATLNNLGDYAGAIRYYDKTLPIDPKNTYALTNKDAMGTIPIPEMLVDSWNPYGIKTGVPRTSFISSTCSSRSEISRF